MIGKSGLHAIRALAVLAAAPRRVCIGAAAIAREIGAPPNYLGKLLQTLSREGLVESQKGAGGGFRLVKSPARISLFAVIDPIEDLGRWDGCFLGGKRCSSEAPCAMHDRWAELREAYLGLLRETSIADLVNNDTPLPMELQS